MLSYTRPLGHLDTILSRVQEKQQKTEQFFMTDTGDKPGARSPGRPAGPLSGRPALLFCIPHTACATCQKFRNKINKVQVCAISL